MADVQNQSSSASDSKTAQKPTGALRSMFNTMLSRFDKVVNGALPDKRTRPVISGPIHLNVSAPPRADKSPKIGKTNTIDRSLNPLRQHSPGIFAQSPAKQAEPAKQLEPINGADPVKKATRRTILQTDVDGALVNRTDVDGVPISKKTAPRPALYFELRGMTMHPNRLPQEASAPAPPPVPKLVPGKNSPDDQRLPPISRTSSASTAVSKTSGQSVWSGTTAASRSGNAGQEQKGTKSAPLITGKGEIATVGYKRSAVAAVTLNIVRGNAVTQGKNSAEAKTTEDIRSRETLSGRSVEVRPQLDSRSRTQTYGI